MAYNTSDGPREVGDLKNEADTDTQLDWDYDYIGLKTGGSTRLVISGAAGNVGIGTVNPSHTLQIASNSGVEGLQVNGAANQYVASFRASTTTGQSYGPYVRAGTNSSDAALIVDNAAGSTSLLKLTGEGKLGIGVSDPDEKLEVSGAIHISAELGGGDIPSTPAANDGGVLYTKEDGKLYYKSNTVAETDVTGGGGSESPNLVTSGYLKVSGSSTLGDATADVVSIVGQLTASQGATLGNASTDKVFINAATIAVPNVPTATDNTVLVVNSSNHIGTDEINAKVWDTKLVENSGTPLNNQLATWTGTTTLAGESNLVFDGSKLQITGKLSASANINSVGYITTAAQLNASGSTTIGGATRISGSLRASGSVVLGDRASVDTTLYSEDIKLVNVPAGTDNSVLVRNPNGMIRTDEIDSRVWGSTLVDATGTPVDNQIAIWTDANTVEGSSNLTFAGATLMVTGGVDVDKNHSDTAAATITGLKIDFDKTGASTSTNTMYGVKVDMDNNTATDGTNYMYGLYVTPSLTHAADAGSNFIYGALINAQGGTNGSSFVQGARIEAGGGDINFGLQIDCEDGGVDLRIESSADNGDYFQIATTAAGATTITTNDDDGTAAHLTINVDGDIDINALGGDVKVTADLAVTGALRAQGQLHITEHAYNTTATTEKWLPFYSLAEANAPNNATYVQQMVVPFGGQLKRVVFRPSGSQGGGTCTAKLYKASTPTQLVNANDSGRYVATSTVSMAAAPARVGVFEFTGSSHFSAGDVVGVSIDPAANPVEVNATCVWEFNVLGV